MERKIKRIQQHVLFGGMNDFLHYCDISSDKFLRAVFRKNELALNVINTLYRYGFANIIIPFNELMRNCLDKDTLNWWLSAQEKIEMYPILFEIEKGFHNKIWKLQLKLVDISFSEYDLPSLFIPYSSVQNVLWDSYPKEKELLLKSGDDQNLGLLMAGIFQINEEYVSQLIKYVLPILFSLSEKKDNIFHVDPFHEGIIKYVSGVYTSELMFKYYAYFSTRTDAILSLKESELSKLRYDDYRDRVMATASEHSVPLYMTCEWVEKFSQLVHICEKQLILQNSIYLANSVIPVMMQCVGMTEKARDYIVSILSGLTIRQKSDTVFLMALYRSLSLEKDYYHTKLYDIMETIFYSRKVPENAIDVIEDIFIFYQDYSSDIINRFDEKSLNSMIESVDDSDKNYYLIYLYSVSSNSINDNVKWVADNLFESGALLSTMDNLIGQVKNNKYDYYTRLIALWEFRKLFLSLFSHADTVPRLLVDEVMRHLNKEDVHLPEDREVFDLYSSRQVQILRNYIQRLSTVMEDIPDFSGVTRFEHISFNQKDDRIKIIEGIVEQHDKEIKAINRNYEMVSRTFQYILSSARRDTNLNSLFMNAFIANPEETKMFYESINEYCDSKENNHLNPQKKRDLKRFATILEYSVSNTEKHKQRVIKHEVVSLMENVISCIPLLNSIYSGFKIIDSLKNIIDTIKLS